MVIDRHFIETNLKGFVKDHCSHEGPPMFKSFGEVRDRLEKVSVEVIEKSFFLCSDQLCLRRVFDTEPFPYFFIDGGMKIGIRCALLETKLSCPLVGAIIFKTTTPGRCVLV